mmetsp:Transcript_55106/g.144955  ORF Transcript_55106/g.144955 Transcript_55106/m.144955 type:complete len:287 (-) Transcript_55106:74-934(-)
MATKEALLGADDWCGWDEEELAAARDVGRRGCYFMLACVAAYARLAAESVPPGPLPGPSVWRAVGEGVLALGMLMELWVDFFKMPPMTKDCEIFELMQKVGKVAFLTFWILVLQTTQMVASFLAEACLLLGLPCAGLLTFSYTIAVFMSTIGIMLTLLFLKFNYFEKVWRTEVKELWERRGIPLGRYTLLAHLPSLPIAVLDLAVVKDKSFLHLCNPQLWHNAGFTVLFGTLYFSWIHVLWWLTNYEHWPYPFLHELDTIAKRLVFLLTIFIGMIVVMLALLSAVY